MGALTAKNYAYRYRSWEMIENINQVSFIVFLRKFK